MSASGDWRMKHDMIVTQLLAEAEGDPNTVGFLLFGSVATGTHRQDSDIDVLTVLRTSRPSSGIENTSRDGIEVGNLYFTYEVLVASVESVPYLVHPLAKAKILFDREGLVTPMLERIRAYFAEHSAIADEWREYYKLLAEEKAEFGHERTTIVDVWNELEKRYSGGRTKRPFFNSFLMTNPRLFSILKRFL